MKEGSYEQRLKKIASNFSLNSAKLPSCERCLKSWKWFLWHV